MASPRKFLGKVPFARALRFTTKVAHVSRQAREKQEGFLEIPGEVTQELENSIEKYDMPGRTHVRLPSWRKMLELAREMQKYVGKQPTYAQALGALVLNKGLENSELRAYAGALYSLNRRVCKTGKSLLAALNKINASKRDKEVLIALFGLKTGKPLSVDEAAERFGLKLGTVYKIKHALLKKLRKHPTLKQIYEENK